MMAEKQKHIINYSACKSVQIIVLTVPNNKKLLIFNYALPHEATCYRLDDRGVGVRVQVGSRIYTSPYSSDLVVVPPNLLYNG
jgi:hypothetical protein